MATPVITSYPVNANLSGVTGALLPPEFGGGLVAATTGIPARSSVGGSLQPAKAMPDGRANRLPNVTSAATTKRRPRAPHLRSLAPEAPSNTLFFFYLYPTSSIVPRGKGRFEISLPL